MPSHVPVGLIIPLAILAISVLVIIHEFGHYLVARAFGMRVITYSIGFGPVLLRWRPRGSETVFQIAAIPLLAYVQIAGMNPRDDHDPSDRGSYQNATPIARFLTIAAGPLANYVAAAVTILFVVAIGGEPIARAQVGHVLPGQPAAAAGFQPDDTIRQINGHPVGAWGDLLHEVQDSSGRPLHMVVERAGHLVDLTVAPRMNAELHRFAMGVEVKPDEHPTYRPVPFSQAIEAAVVGPARQTAFIVTQIVGMVQHKVPVEFVGPPRIVQETVRQAQKGWREMCEWLGVLSLELFIFNLLPIPALDGGRLVVLGYEMVSRRRPNPQIEAKLLSWSLMLMLSLVLIVSSRELWGMIVGLFRG